MSAHGTVLEAPGDGSEASPSEVLVKVSEVSAAIRDAGVRCCHWKSNFQFHRALGGEGDLDLLVDPTQFNALAGVLLRHDLKAADSIASRQQPGVFHFLGNDPGTGTLLNFHCYSRILTGDRFLKSWALPFETMLLEDVPREGGIEIPTKSAELVVFTLRQMLKHGSLMDVHFGRSSRSATTEELDWLTQDPGVVPGAVERLSAHFPEIPPADFLAAVELLRDSPGPLRRLRAGRRFQRMLRKYRRYGAVARAGRAMLIVVHMAINRLVFRQKHMTLRTGGKIIAFVGPQATGKSTLATAAREWLGAELAIRQVHVGKPPPTFATWIPVQMIPLARRLFAGQKTRSVDRRTSEEADFRFPVLYLVRKVLLAIDRQKLLRRVFRETRNGRIVLCDRYPSDNRGAIDGPSYRPEMMAAQKSSWKRRLMRWEDHIYSRICPPDLVLEFTVSVEKAVERNRHRQKKDPQDTSYVRQRHAMQHLPRFDRCPVVEICTDASLEDTLIEVKNAIWNHL